MSARVRTLAIVLAAAAALLTARPAGAQEEEAPAPVPTTMPAMDSVLDAIDKAAAGGEEGADWTAPVKLAVIFAGLAILPSLLVMMTSFTRIVIVLGFVRRALTTQNIPPTVAIIGLGLFLTIFTMSPAIGQMNNTAMQPYLDGEITFSQAIARANLVLKDWMLRQTERSDLALFAERAKLGPIESPADVPTWVAIPSFAISEFRTAFEMGALLFIPFLLIDLVTAAILLSAGMMMLPPAMVSLPFKIILFVLVDGWKLLTNTLIVSFN